MAIETFTWYPRVNAEADVKHRVRKASFGDGYTQVAGDGINPRTQEWNLSFIGTEEYIQPILDFLDRMAGTKSFLWKPPLNPLGFWRCEEYKAVAMGGDNYTLTATFEQAFKP